VFRFRTDEEKVNEIGAGDEHHESDGRHDNPQNTPYIADDLLLERVEIRRNAPDAVVVRVSARAVRPGIHPDRDEVGDVGVGLLDGYTRFEVADAVVAERCKFLMDGIKRERQEEVALVIRNAKVPRHDADDRMRLGINLEDTADDRRIASKAALPITVAQHDSPGPARVLVGG
jgi:hypothetical protein